MLAEVLIFVPSVARFRADYLQARLDRAQIASLALLGNDMLDMNLEKELLANAGVYNVVLVRDLTRQLMLSAPIPASVSATYDMRSANWAMLIRDAFSSLLGLEGQVIRIVGAPVRGGGTQIEVTMASAPLQDALLEYGLNILLLSLFISAITGALLFYSARRLLVLPINRLVAAMKNYADAPEDARRVISPTAGVGEINEAETALKAMQTQLTGALRQKDRLAQLGSAVAKISHDLRNILTTAQLFADRMEASEDPAVKRAAPKLIASINRAVALCEGTLAFGRAEEPPPSLARVALAEVVADVIEGEQLAAGDVDVSFETDIPASLILRADPEQLFRVLSNLIRNARQAIGAKGQPGQVHVTCTETEREWILSVADTGPGLPAMARDHLFTPFQGGIRKGGTGLGLAIASELVRGHGGHLDLCETGPDGTVFAINLPKSNVSFDEAAE